eukprot:4174013-Prymnesium_polylepis.1
MCQGPAPGRRAGPVPVWADALAHGASRTRRAVPSRGVRGGDGGCGSWFLVVPGNLGRFWKSRISQLSKKSRGCPISGTDRNDQAPPGTRNHGWVVSSHEVGLGAWCQVVPGHLGRFWKSQIPTFKNREMGFAISRIDPNDQAPPGTKHQVRPHDLKPPKRGAWC